MTINTPAKEAERLKIDASVFGEGEVRQPRRMLAPPPTVPSEDNPMSTRKWLKRYGLVRQRLSLEKFLASNSVLSISAHVSSTGGRPVHGRLGEMFPVQLRSRRIFKKGKQEGIWYVMAKPREVAEYRAQLASHLERLRQRLAWLCTGPERVFGMVTKKRIFLAIDVSGSMYDAMPFLRETVGDLLRNVVLPRCEAFGLACFNDTVNPLARCLLDVDQDTVGAALKWLGQQQATGGTRLEPVLELCLSELHNVDAVYLVSDGLTEESMRHLMERIADWRAVRKVQVNTISFNCTDVSTNRFLGGLAAATAGHFRQFQTSTTSRAEVIGSEDVQLIEKEISKGERCLEEAAVLEQQLIDSLDDSATEHRQAMAEQAARARPAWNAGGGVRGRRSEGPSTSRRRAAGGDDGSSTNVGPGDEVEAKSTRSQKLRQRWLELQGAPETSIQLASRRLAPEGGEERDEDEDEEDAEMSEGEEEEEENEAAEEEEQERNGSAGPNLPISAASDRPDIQQGSRGVAWAGEENEENDQDDARLYSRHANVRRVAAVLDDLLDHGSASEASREPVREEQRPRTTGGSRPKIARPASRHGQTPQRPQSGRVNAAGERISVLERGPLRHKLTVRRVERSTARLLAIACVSRLCLHSMPQSNSRLSFFYHPEHWSCISSISLADGADG
jgi:hypothetical protein